MSNIPNILIIDDNKDVRLSAHFLLSNHGFNLLQADSESVGLQVLKQQSVDLILLDMNFTHDTTSGEEGLRCLAKIRSLTELVPVIVITAWASSELVVKALKNGAQDFIEKPWDNQRLIQVINQNLQLEQLKYQNQRLKQQIDEQRLEVNIIAESAAMKALMKQLDEVAKTHANILLTGDNGTGKSTLAQYIHLKSKQRSASLVSVNMGAIVENLFESEMFGHTKGAFTGAYKNRIGRFELAQNGTLFMDEIANIPLSQQAKLLRVIESREFEAVGSSKTLTTNARLICASNAHFPDLIAAGQFRQDLFYRLNTIELKVPCLKERQEDIPLLAQQFLAQHCQYYHKPPMTLSSEVITFLQSYNFPGNLRELSQLLERIVITADSDDYNNSSADDSIMLTDLNRVMPALINQTTALTQQNASQAQPAIHLPLSDENLFAKSLMTLAAAEKILIETTLRHTKGQVNEAASLLDISLSALYRRLEKYQIIAKDFTSNQQANES